MAMAPDDAPNVHSSAASSGLFTRRPSFFGISSSHSKPKASKGHAKAKASRASLSYSSSSQSHSYHGTSASPPVLNLPPALNLSPVFSLSPLHLSPAPSTTATATAPDETPLDPNQYDNTQHDHHPSVPATPHHRRHASRHSIAASVTEIGSSLRRSHSAALRISTSSTGTASSSSHKRTPSTNLALAYSPEKVPNAPATAPRPTLSISTFSRSKQKSSDNVKPDGAQNAHVYDKSPLSAVDRPKTPFGMAVPMPLRHPPTQKEILHANRQPNTQLAPSAPIPLPNSANPNIIFQQIHELASKRISTLDYLRKAWVHSTPSPVSC
jgi:pyruvate/2-oxoglutarate dehydrogenase complex dihydrolipoamide acyltransferase (E2) component